MTPAEFKERMQKVDDDFSGDFEAVHSVADKLLIECLRSLGYAEGCDIFDELEKWYA